MAYLPETWGNNAVTTLSAAISTTTRPVTFTVTSAAGMPSTGNFRVKVDSEILLITSISGTSLTGTNVEGTTAATHASGSQIAAIITAGALAQLEIDTNNGIGAAPNVVSFSATPTFDCSLSRVQQITLTGNVTSSTFSNLTPGQMLCMVIAQDATGGRTFAWPTGVHGAMVPGTTASTYSAQLLLATTNAASGLVAVTPGVINQ